MIRKNSINNGCGRFFGQTLLYLCSTLFLSSDCSEGGISGQLVPCDAVFYIMLALSLVTAVVFVFAIKHENFLLVILVSVLYSIVLIHLIVEAANKRGFSFGIILLSLLITGLWQYSAHLHNQKGRK